jgi:hypothetical protein
MGIFSKSRRKFTMPLVLAILLFALMTSMAAATDHSGHCGGMGGAGDNGPTALCLEHCNGASQVVDHHSPAPLVGAARIVPLIVASAQHRPVVLLVSAHIQPSLPDSVPIFASSSRLRI